jgi:hypothetical protein
MKKQSNGRLFKVYLGAVVIFATSVGSVLAAGINIGASTRGTEFGQGVYLIKACDDWIQLNLVVGATGANGAPAGYSALTGITIEGLDVSKCSSTKFSIGARSASGSVLPLYRTDRQRYMCSQKACVIGTNAQADFDLAVSSKKVVSLSVSNSYHSLSYSSSTATYTVSFTQPAILATDVSSLIIQSSSI